MSRVVVWISVYDDGDSNAASNAAVVGALLSQWIRPYVSELRVNGVLIFENKDEEETPADSAN